jgi:hypothetical protein
MHVLQVVISAYSRKYLLSGTCVIYKISFERGSMQSGGQQPIQRLEIPIFPFKITENGMEYGGSCFMQLPLDRCLTFACAGSDGMKYWFSLIYGSLLHEQLKATSLIE